MFSDLASVEHEIKKTLRHLIIISFINLIKPYTNTIKRFGRPIYRTLTTPDCVTVDDCVYVMDNAEDIIDFG